MQIKRIVITSLILAVFNVANAQKASDTILFNIKPYQLLIGETAIYASGIYLLNETWYKSYPKSEFHWFNDNKEWLQVDKAGHTFGAYQLALQNAWLLKQTGVKSKNAAFISSGISIVSMSTIELFDGLCSEWGASWGDIVANTAGTATFLAQELYLGKQIVRIKYGYKPSPYANKHPDKLGSNKLEHLLKDYNAQSYWLSASLNEMLNLKKIPLWIAIAVGYGAGGMTSANPSTDNTIKRYRQIMISPDINWEKIPVRRKGLKVLFRTLNMIKIPLPTLSVQKNKLTFILN